MRHQSTQSISPGAKLDSVLQDAVTRIPDLLPGAKNVQVGDLGYEVWIQTWGSTTCGFPGVGAAAITYAQTVLVYAGSRSVLVYHGGRFAYLADGGDLDFQQCRHRRSLAGAGDLSRTYGTPNAEELLEGKLP